MNGTRVGQPGRMMNVNRVRVALLVAAAVAALDLLWVLLTRVSLVVPGVTVAGRGLAVRLLLLATLLVGRWLLAARSGWHGVSARAALLLALLGSLYQFHCTGPRVVGDGMMYYVYVRSLWKDFDLDFADEYEHYGLLRPDRGDLIRPIPGTGMRRSIFSIGPAILWTPFFGAAEAVARVRRLSDPGVDLTGYGPIHWNAVALGSLLYGFGAVAFVYGFLRRHYSAAIALLAALLMWAATFLHWYMVDQPTYAHACSTFLAAAAIWLWDRERAQRRAWGFFLWGLCLGLAMCVRWQNGVLLLLPGIELLARLAGRLRGGWGWRRSTLAAIEDDAPALRADTRPGPVGAGFKPAPMMPTCLTWRSALASVIWPGLALTSGVLLGAFPQMAAWKALYGEWLLRYPPHGAGFVRLDHPFLLETLFSSRHGLLAWTPAFWLAALGFVPAWRRRLSIAAPLALCVAVMSYVNVCAGDWWAGASFSNRRFDSTLPLFAFGMAAALEWLRDFTERRPAVSLTALLLPVVVWYLCGVWLLKTGELPREQTISFADRVGQYATAVSRTVGSPPTWPASWLFAIRHRVAPNKYDEVVGRYLFYRQNNLGGRIDIGEPRGDTMLAEGWGPARIEEGVSLRAIAGPARLFASLDVPEALVITVRGRATEGPCALALSVNGVSVGEIRLDSAWSSYAVHAPRALWQRETNDVALTPRGCRAAIDLVDFQQETRP